MKKRDEKKANSLDQIDETSHTRSSVCRIPQPFQVRLKIHLEVRREHDRLAVSSEELFRQRKIGWVLNKRSKLRGEVEDGGVVESVLIVGEEDFARDTEAEQGEVRVLWKGELGVLKKKECGVREEKRTRRLREFDERSSGCKDQRR